MTATIWGPLRKVSSSLVSAPREKVDVFQAAHQAGVARQRDLLATHPTEWDGDVVGVSSVKVESDGVVHIQWYESSWAELRWRREQAISPTAQIKPPTARWLTGFSAAVWLFCPDGLVVAERAFGLLANQFVYTSGEMVEVEEMAPVLNLASIGRRALVEEVGVTPSVVVPWRWQQTWYQGWLTTVNLLAWCDHSFAEITHMHKQAQDGHEALGLHLAHNIQSERFGFGLLVPSTAHVSLLDEDLF